jgi:hypothetical protein
LNKIKQNTTHFPLNVLKMRILKTYCQGWRGRGVEGWRFGGVEVWRGGGLEGWRFGGVEVWRGGGLEGWRFGWVGYIKLSRPEIG